MNHASKQITVVPVVYTYLGIDEKEYKLQEKQKS
jgi:hypothetical protein